MAEPGIGEYLKAAFKVPYNLILFTGGMLAGVVSLYPQIVWPLVLAAELVYLTTMATRPRFQAVVRARRQAEKKAEVTDVVPRVFTSPGLSSYYSPRASSFSASMLRLRNFCAMTSAARS